MKRSQLLGAVCGCLFTFVTSANAALVTFAFEGFVDQVDAAHDGFFYINQSISGTYTFESSATDVDSRSEVGDYDGALVSFNINIGPSYSLSLASSFNTIFIAYQPDFNSELYEPIADVDGPDVNGLTPSRFDIFLQAVTGNPLSSALLPLTPPDLALFDRNTDWILTFDQPNLLAGEITSLTIVTPVPLPPSLWLFGTGMLGLLGTTRQTSPGAGHGGGTLS